MNVPTTKETRYFARVSAGLEPLAWGEIERIGAARLLALGHRRVDFAYAGEPAALLGLRAVDDVYVTVARMNGLDHTRATLARLSAKLATVDFAPALALVASVRALPDIPQYRVTASHLGRRNYSRYDVEGAVERALTPLLPWRFVLNHPDEPEPDLDLRVLLEDDWVLLGLRLAAAPLHRRDYKQASRPGSLKAPVAASLLLLAAAPLGAALLDPACGAGTILAEAWALDPTRVIVGGDLDAESLALARTNLDSQGAPARVAEAASTIAPADEPAGVILYAGDARAVPLPASSVGAVVSNLPWGSQAPLAEEVGEVYRAMLREVARVLAPGGRAVLLTDQAEAMRAALDDVAALAPLAEHPISLFGKHPRAYVLVRHEDG